MRTNFSNPPRFITLVSNWLFYDVLVKGDTPLNVSAEFAVLHDVCFHSFKWVCFIPSKRRVTFVLTSNPQYPWSLNPPRMVWCSLCAVINRSKVQFFLSQWYKRDNSFCSACFWMWLFCWVPESDNGMPTLTFSHNGLSCNIWYVARPLFLW